MHNVEQICAINGEKRRISRSTAPSTSSIKVYHEYE